MSRAAAARSRTRRAAVADVRPAHGRLPLGRSIFGRLAFGHLVLACLALAACAPEAPPPTAARPAAPAGATKFGQRALADAASPPLVRAARAQVGVTKLYDPAYVRLAYPGGDVTRDRGVCTDVIVRALRAQGLDLQRLIHEDRIAHPAAYAMRGQPRAADASIDHRRVPNQMAWFARQGWSRAIDPAPAGYAAGDIVAWRLPNGPLHVGIVSDRANRSGVPLVLHNIGSGTREEDLLLRFAIIGHYRPALPAVAARRMNSHR